MTHYRTHPLRGRFSQSELDDLLDQSERSRVVIACKSIRQACSLRQALYNRRRSGAPCKQMLSVVERKLVMEPRGSGGLPIDINLELGEKE